MANLWGRQIYMPGRQNGFLVSSLAHRLSTASCDYSFPESQQRLSPMLEYLGDAPMNTQQLDNATSNYPSTLSPEPVVPSDLLIKQSKTSVALSLWEDTLNDVDRVCSFISCKSVLDGVFSRSHLIHPLHGATRRSTQLYTAQVIMKMPSTCLRQCF